MVCHLRWCCVSSCLFRLMWAAHLRAPLPTQCVLSSHGTLVPRGIFWCPCVLVHPSPPHYAPQSSTLPASISLVQLRAGGGKSFTLASFASVGKYWIHQVQQIQQKKRGNFWGKFFFLIWLQHNVLAFWPPYRSVRFRWYQGFFSTGSAPPTWALDNVYIGPQCQDMCNGHGACVGGTHCMCDPGYSGSDCSAPDTPNPDFLKEDFEGIPTYRCTQKSIILVIACLQ